MMKKCLVTFVLACLATLAHGQTAEQGVYPGLPYDHDILGNVNLASGDLSIQAKLISLPQLKGINVGDLILSYNTLTWTDAEYCSAQGEDCTFQWLPNGNSSPYFMEGGYFSWGSVAYMDLIGNPSTYGWTVQSGDGNVHNMVPVSGGFRTIDGTDMLLNSNATKLTDSLGTTYTISPPSGSLPENSNYSYSEAYPTTIKNIHGQGFTPGTTIMDSVGRLYTTANTSDYTGCTGSRPTIAATIYSVRSSQNVTYPTMKACYANIVVQTNFGGCHDGGDDCEYNGSEQVLQSMVLSTNSPAGAWAGGYAWTFSYGASDSSDAGYVNLGLLTAITSPEGGTVTYTYSDTSSPTVLSRSVNANDGNGNATTSYTYSGFFSPYDSKTVVTNPDGSTTEHDINSTTGSDTETIYHDTSGNVLQTITRTYISVMDPYNDYTGSFPEDGNSYLTGQTMTWPNGISCFTGTAYSSYLNYNISFPQTGIPTRSYSGIAYYGEPSSSSIEDCGSGSGGSVLSATTYQWQDQASSQYFSENLFHLPQSQVTKDGSGNPVDQVTYGYDANGEGAVGDQTSTAQAISSTASLTTQTKYNTSGQPITVTDPYGQATTLGYEPSEAYDQKPTSVELPTPSSGVALSTGALYDPYSYLQTSATDANGNTTSTSYDGLFRPTQINDPDGGMTTYTYTPNSVEVREYQNANVYSHTEMQYDGLDRLSRVASSPSIAANVWYQQDTCYDSNGNVSFRSYEYQGAGFGTSKICSGSGGDSYTYDDLGRQLSIMHGDGTKAVYQYTGRATEKTDENGVKRITQVDGLGRTTIVCELSPNTLQGDAPTSCGTDITGTGFVTTYSYSLAAHTATVKQGVQTRTSQTDWVGRIVNMSEPESGTTTYSYTSNSTGLVVTRTRPRANQSSASVTTATTTQYDALSRPISIGYNDGTATKSFLYDTGVGWGQMQSNVRGRLSKASVPALGNQEEEILSYDAVGRVLFTGQCFAYSCGNASKDKYIYDTYDWTGNLLSQSDPSAGQINYTYNQANQLLSATNQTYTDSTNPPNLISSVANGPDGPVSYQQGNGLGSYRTYDGLGRNDGRWLCQGTAPSYHCETGSEHQVYGTELTWSGGQVIYDCDTAIGTCRNFGYDEFARLKSQSVNNATQYTYIYDRYGNRWQQNAAQGGPSPSVQFNKSTNQIAGDGYDAAGNLTSDGIHSYTYDAEGNVTGVDGGQTASYTYDALNHRVRVANASNTVDYTFDAMGRRVTTWQESSDFGIEGSEYWGATSERIAYRNGPTIFENQDWLGTERMRTNANGSLQNDFASLPFGDGLSGGSDTDSAHFAGLDHDAESLTDHAQFRQYSETMGRWNSPDPYSGSYDWSDPQSLNRYSYALNNPLSATDPSGLVACNGGGDGGNGGIADTDGCDPGDLPYEQALNQDMADEVMTAFANAIKLNETIKIYSYSVLSAFDGTGMAGVLPVSPAEPQSTNVAQNSAPSNGRNCSAGSASAGQYAAATAQVAAMTAQFFSGAGPGNQTFGPGTSTSAVMGQSAGVQDVLNNYYMTGQTSGLYSFGGAGYVSAGANPVAQFVGSFRWSISGGNLSLTNTTSFKSLTYDAGPQWQRSSFSPMGNTHQTYQIGVTCH
jgi:RHS repeat-associated protein